jgi:hypothetical protein
MASKYDSPAVATALRVIKVRALHAVDRLTSVAGSTRNLVMAMPSLTALWVHLYAISRSCSQGAISSVMKLPIGTTTMQTKVTGPSKGSIAVRTPLEVSRPRRDASRPPQPPRVRVTCSLWSGGAASATYGRKCYS